MDDGGNDFVRRWLDNHKREVGDVMFFRNQKVDARKFGKHCVYMNTLI